jgi:hypothetical protein
MSLSTSTPRPVYTAEQRMAWLNAKALCKALSLEIREAKSHRKAVPHEGVYRGHNAADAVRRLSARYRALHIAMSLLRGKTMGQIEGAAETHGPQYRHAWAYYRMGDRIQEWQSYFANPGAKKLYILVDAKLSTSQQAVQSAHAAAKFHKDFPLAPWTNGTIVLMKLTGENTDRKSWYRPVKFENFTQGVSIDGSYTTMWLEPDLGNKPTAVALLSEYNNEKRNGRINGTSLL